MLKIFLKILGILFAIPVIGYISLFCGLFSIQLLCNFFGKFCPIGSWTQPEEKYFILAYFIVFMSIFIYFLIKYFKKS